MPVIVPDSTLWEATGHATATTSVVVTHPDAGGTTEGSTVIVAVRSSGAIGWTPPAGWITDVGINTPGISAFRLDNAPAAATSWTFTRSTSGNTAWYMRESDHLSLYESFEVASAGTNGATASGGTRSTATTALNAGSQVVAIAVFGSTKAAGGDVHSWAGYTNGFTERADFDPAGVAGQGIAIADRVYDTQGTYDCTATFTTSTGTPQTGGMLLLYRADDATINAPLAYCTGFEFGTHGGMGNAAASSPHRGGVSGSSVFGTNYQVSAGAAKDGGYGLEVANAASGHWVQCPPLTAGGLSFSGHVKPVSGTGTPVALWFNGIALWLVYDVTNEQFGLRWNNTGSETTVWQTGTTPFGTYPAVQIRAKFNGSIHHADWWIETGTGDGFQTSPTDPTGRNAETSTYLALGAAAAQTAVFHYDNLVFSRYYAAWPLEPHTVRLLVPEATGASVVGTSANFKRFTANGTLANVDGTEGALLDEAPPTVSASSDGVVQVTAAASDYIELPMTTYTCDPNEIIAGVRFVASEWGGTGTGTGTLGWRGYDGLTETVFQAVSASYDADSLTSISATYPRWVSAMWSGATSGAWTQERLDDAATRMGWSTDATPDMGASAVYLEVATRQISNSWVVHRLTDDEDPEVNAAMVTQTLHPYNSAVRTYSVSNDDPTRTAVFNYSIGGTPQTPVTVAPSDPPVDVTVGAEDFGEVDTTSFSWQ